LTSARGDRLPALTPERHAARVIAFRKRSCPANPAVFAFDQDFADQGFSCLV